MKTKEELNALKAEYASLSRKLGELTDDELKQVTGGIWYPFKNNELPSTAIGGEKQDHECGFFPGLPAFP